MGRNESVGRSDFLKWIGLKNAAFQSLKQSISVWPFGVLDNGSATLRCKIWSLPFLGLRPHALHPGAIQGKEGIKFCHLATTVCICELCAFHRGPALHSSGNVSCITLWPIRSDPIEMLLLWLSPLPATTVEFKVFQLNLICFKNHIWGNTYMRSTQLFWNYRPPPLHITPMMTLIFTMRLIKQDLFSTYRAVLKSGP